MKKQFVNGGLASIGAALIGAMCVLAFAACPDTSATKVTPNDNASITKVKIGGGEAVNPALSDGDEDITSVSRSRYELPAANMKDRVTLSVTRNNAGQTISWAKVAATVITPPDDLPFTQFARPASGNVLSAVVSSNGLANGEKIYIEVISSDKKTILYYGFTISVGNVARLAGLSLGGTEITAWSETGEEGLWDKVNMVAAFYRDEAPAGGSFALAASAEDGGIISYAVTTDSAATPSYTDLPATPPALQLATGSILYIKVTSANGRASVTHKVNIFLKASATIRYGQPTITLGTGGGAPVLDALWNSQNWVFSIDRINMAELIPEFRFLYSDTAIHYDETGHGHTEGRAKALWDDDGLYVYAEMTVYDYSEYNGTAPPHPTERTIVVTPAGVADSDAHLYDSLEIFTNERVQAYTAGNYGVQYRVAPSPAGASTAGTNSRISGNNPSGNTTAIEAFRTSGRYYTWIRKDGAGKELGYSIIAYIPWAFKNDPAANQMFNTDGTVKAGAVIGMEFQINAVTEEDTRDDTRDAVLTWNGVAGPSYQQVGNYGKVTLSRN